MARRREPEKLCGKAVTQKAEEGRSDCTTEHIGCKVAASALTGQHVAEAAKQLALDDASGKTANTRTKIGDVR